MSSPDPVMRMLRLMTHFNIGAILATAAWVLWSGAQIVSGHLAPGYRPDEVRRLVQLPSTPQTSTPGRHATGDAGTPMRLVPVREARLAAQAEGAPPGTVPWCHPRAALTPARAAPLQEADL